MPGANGGTQVVTNQTDIAIGRSGQPVRVFFVSMTSGGTAGVCILRNGTTASGTAYHQIDGTISKSVTQYFGANGLLFPGGCFLDVDANCAVVTVAFEQNTL